MEGGLVGLEARGWKWFEFFGASGGAALKRVVQVGLRLTLFFRAVFLFAN